ncbi:MAG: GGDEF domain-containing protein [Butyrivibrio sp.]|uniref:GGDEF domain-containing protein n=1 Tax=Butyrivibrio sp. TaxID=28121 RepID=UPI0025C29260|nr:GGDEF domain-containing protein [Butyrivibrio sp.]MBQ6588984.1 GGDEF domain-containing protein [Butyrivibrio sp.]
MIGGKKVVALCTYRIYETHEFDFIYELGKMIPEHDCSLFIYAMNSEIGIIENHTPEVEVYDLIPYNKVDVVVVMNEKIKSRSVCQSIIDKSNAAGVPVLVVDGHYENVSTVNYDYLGGFEKVLIHMFEHHKVKKPHFMAGHRNNAFSNERIELFKKYMTKYNLPFDDSMVSYGDFWALPCRAATAELLKRDELPDSIICANDIMAINVCDVLKENGIRVPEDILVSGFDGIDEAFISSPGITTAICDKGELAHTVMGALDEILAGKRNVIKWIEPVFIPNESCDCPRKDLHVTATVSDLNNLFYHHEDEIHALQNIISKMLVGEDVKKSIRYVKENHARHAKVIVEKSCFDLENNFFYDDVEKGDKMVIYDSYDDTDRSYPYNPDEIVPNLKELIQTGQPLVFNCLLYMNKCLGFVCYTYPRMMLIDYNQTPNLTNCFEMSIGGYVVNMYQKYLRDKVREMYQNDALTGLYNRLAFRSLIDEILSKPERIGQKITVIMMDLNNLKQINDTLGHMVGDKAIKAVATALKESCPDDALCVRAGGDELLGVIIGDCDVAQITGGIERNLENASKELGISVSASTGVYTTLYEEGMDIGKIINIADERMYEMKRKIKAGRIG